MRTRIVITACALAALLAIAAPSSAQTHPCDVAQPTTSISTKVPFTVGFCVPSTDQDGNPTIITSGKIYIDGGVAKISPVAPIGPPNAAGLNYYEVPGVTTSKAPHTLTAASISVDGEGLLSDPLPFAVIGAPPKKTIIVRIR